MKINGILNSDISYVLSLLGHYDTITICDAGLPIPPDVKRIDIALKKGQPSFLDVLSEVYADMKIESFVLAKEIVTKNDKIHKSILTMMSTIPVEYIKHNDFKELTKKSRAIIRTGECTPYANIILKSGVLF